MSAQEGSRSWVRNPEDRKEIDDAEKRGAKVERERIAAWLRKIAEGAKLGGDKPAARAWASAAKTLEHGNGGSNETGDV